MIIAGYPGIGKTTLAKDNVKIIDLESSIFNKKKVDWFIDYVNVAIELDKQGYDVFISTHEEVLSYLDCYLKDKWVLIYPTYELKDLWLKELETRLENDNTMKNLKACLRVKDKFDNDITSLMNNYKTAKHYRLKDTNYNLKFIYENHL